MVIRWLRWVAGIAVLAALGLAAWVLAPAYWNHWRLQRDLDALLARALAEQQPAEQIRQQIVHHAARYGIPLRQQEIRLRATPDKIEAEALYLIRVNLPVYTVDLHFRARARARR